MTRHKKSRLTTRNWEALMEQDETAIASFQKLYHHNMQDNESYGQKPQRARQSFHRERTG